MFLHRNQIRRISNLSGCPRIRKLWLFQNQIDDISGLLSLPELEDCWLQSNQITSLQGVEYCINLKVLGLAGNPISNMQEIKRLTNCAKLIDISFSDIHFGRCPLSEEKGFREYVLLQLKQLKILDGVKITSESVQSAEETYFDEVKFYSFLIFSIT